MSTLLDTPTTMKPANRFMLKTQLTTHLRLAMVGGALASSVVFMLLSFAQDSPLTHWGAAAVAALALLGAGFWLSKIQAQEMLAPVTDWVKQMTSEPMVWPIHPDVKQATPAELLPLLQLLEQLNEHTRGLEANFSQEMSQRTSRLAQSETQLNHVLAAGSEGFWDWDLNKRQIQVSPRALQLFGLSGTCLLYPETQLIQMLDAEQRDSYLATLVERLKCNEPTLLEVRLHRPDGSTFWAAINNLTVERDAEKRATRVVGSIRDISARKAAEFALAASEERLRLATLGNLDGVWDWKPSTGEVFLSDRWKSMLGHEPHEIGQNIEEWTQRVHPDDLPRAMKEVQNHLDGHTSVYVSKHRMRHKQGHYLWILDRGQAQRGADGKVIRMVGTHTDVTELHQTQLALQEQTHELDTILALSPAGLVAVDLRGRVKYTNNAFSMMTGYPSDQINGLEADLLWKYVCDRCKPAPKSRRLSEVPDGATGERFLLEISRPAHRILDVTRHACNCANLAYIVCLNDVSWEVDMNRLKSEFLSTAAHELRTPLASIFGFAEVLLNQPTDPKSRREYTSIIYRQAQTMSLLLDELLDLSRIEALQGQDFQAELTSVCELVEQVVECFKRPNHRDAPTIDCPDGNLQVLADPGKVQQALLNILSNAYKYSPEGGLVRIDIRQVTQPHCAPQVGIFITDTGIGMTEAQVTRLGERFYRVNPTSKVPGSGLGMSIAREIAHRHGGSISVTSTLNNGSTIGLQLPAAL